MTLAGRPEPTGRADEVYHLPAPPQVRSTLQAALLNVAEAWRADFGRLARSSANASDLADDEWLFGFSTRIARLRAMAPGSRPAYAREWASSWRSEGVAAPWPDFHRIVGVVEEWSGAAPAMPAFRELLRAVEQIEAAGALHTAYTALMDLMLLVPSQDLRAGYARAQSGRVLRTLGLVGEAEAAFEAALEIARKKGDRWLLARCGLGIGVLLRKRGSYPAARAMFESVLVDATDHADLLTGAHLGLVMVARVADEYDTALAHAWEALSLSRGDKRAEVEALAVLSTLSLDVGEYVAARRSCQTALSLSPELPMRQPLVRTAVEAAVALGDENLIDEYYAELKQNAHQTLNPWEQAHALRVLSRVHARHARHDDARACLLSCSRIAREHGYAELSWVVTAALETVDQEKADMLEVQAVRRRGTLDESSRVVIRRILELAPR